MLVNIILKSFVKKLYNSLRTKERDYPFRRIASLCVRLKGLEPPRLSAPDPKSGVATNYTTAAEKQTAKVIINYELQIVNYNFLIKQ